jgi:glc operon protein GlcG
MLRTTICRAAALAMTGMALSQSASAAELPRRSILTLEAARGIAAAAEAKARAEGWPCVIAVADQAGLPILLVRMDDAAVTAGVELAPGKARTAALFSRPSGALEDAINCNRAAAATARGFVMMRGGLPILAEGRVVGAIGVSADTPQHDEQIAQAGLAAFGH